MYQVSRLLNMVPLSAGCTLTLILITDWLLTVAGIGDSKAVLDLGAQFLDLSPEHRVHNHLSEQDRLKRAGSYLAPVRYVRFCSRIHFGVDGHLPHACYFNCARTYMACICESLRQHGYPACPSLHCLQAVLSASLLLEHTLTHTTCQWPTRNKALHTL